MEALYPTQTTPLPVELQAEVKAIQLHCLLPHLVLHPVPHLATHLTMVYTLKPRLPLALVFSLLFWRLPHSFRLEYIFHLEFAFYLCTISAILIRSRVSA